MVSELQLSPDDVREALRGVLRSPSFAGAERRKKLLEYLVEQTLSGHGDALKEFNIGVEVYGRDPSTYDPRLDPIVRVDIGRLRTKLREYYATEGRNDPIRIELPKGSYSMVFRPEDITTAELPKEPAQLIPAATDGGWKQYGTALALALIFILGSAAYFMYRWTRPAAGIHSIVVLPFLDLSANHQDEYFTDGLTDELTGALSHVHGLRVVARTSAYQFKGKGEDIRTIGQTLHVDAVIEGSVQRTADRVRVTVQVDRAADGYHLWSNTFDEGANDLFRVEDEISHSIGGALRVRVAGGNLASPRQTNNPEAHALYLKARYLWNKRSIPALHQSMELLDRAIEKDPEYAMAYSATADCYAVLGVNEEAVPGDAMPKAISAAQHALALDDSIGEAHVTLAYAKFFYDHDPQGAQSEFRRAIDLNPSYATAYHWYGNMLVALRRFGEARAELERARELDPLSLVVAVALSNADYYARNYERSQAEAREILKIDPDFWMAHALLAAPADTKGHFEEAVEEARKAYALSGQDLEQLSNLGTLYAMNGKRDQALRIIGDLQSKQKDRYVSAMFLADIYAALADREHTFALLQDAEQQHAISLMFLAVDPAFDSFRRDADFGRLLQRLNLPN